MCQNGHVINTSVKTSPKINQKYCDKCGEKTETACTLCGFEICGKYNVPGVLMLGGKDYVVPKHCYNCGNPYPWTKNSLEAANDLVAEIDQLSQEDVDILQNSLNDLVSEGPRTEVATIRFKKIMKKVGSETGETIKNVLVDVLSEAVKKSIWG